MCWNSEGEESFVLLPLQGQSVLEKPRPCTAVVPLFGRAQEQGVCAVALLWATVQSSFLGQFGQFNPIVDLCGRSLVPKFLSCTDTKD